MKLTLKSNDILQGQDSDQIYLLSCCEFLLWKTKEDILKKKKIMTMKISSTKCYFWPNWLYSMDKKKQL